MDHGIVMAHMRTVIKDKRILSIIHQYLDRVEIRDGEYHALKKGIPKGCPLSPLVGAIILKSLDEMLPEGTPTVRYMDDWMIFAKTRSQCRRFVKKMHQVMQQLKFTLAVDKTYIGKVSNGFDFLGYRFDDQGIVGLAKKTVINFKERLLTLYEQGAPQERIKQYVRRWCAWCLIPFKEIITQDEAIGIIQGSCHGEINNYWVGCLRAD